MFNIIIETHLLLRKSHLKKIHKLNSLFIFLLLILKSTNSNSKRHLWHEVIKKPSP